MIHVIRFKHKGDFSKTKRFLSRSRKITDLRFLDKYGKKGVEALSSATPVETGETANSWYYEIKRGENSVSITFCNSHVHGGVPIALMLQFGHGTKNGGWVDGRDYINPAIQPIFDEMVNEAWREVTSR